ncbi:MAG: glutamate 5-kinase [Pseudomonadota bacterium]
MDAVTSASTLASAKLVVVKVGSALLVDPITGDFQSTWLDALADDAAALRMDGKAVVIVSSGAIAMGRAEMGLAAGALSLEQTQAAAAIGQTRLVGAWGAAFARHDLRAAQVLLTLEDTQNRRRYLNGRSTLAALLAMGAIPVVNENDTVATDEIRYGDNDRLAARVALMAGAEALVLLSDVDGLYSGDPRQEKGAQHIADVHSITPEIEAMAGGTGTSGAKGGMKTKLQAAKIAMQGGCAMAVMKGNVMNPLAGLIQGARATWFHPTIQTAAARKQWIAGMKSRGSIAVDDGAVAALRRGKSLLPAGIREVQGDFQRGDPVTVTDAKGHTVAMGLAGYKAAEARQIQGQRSDAIAGILGYPGRAAMLHADDILIWGT